MITYLLEQGLFDTNTLFSNEVGFALPWLILTVSFQIDSKPPNFNKTSEEEEVVQSRGLPMIRYLFFISVQFFISDSITNLSLWDTLDLVIPSTVLRLQFTTASKPSFISHDKLNIAGQTLTSAVSFQNRFIQIIWATIKEETRYCFQGEKKIGIWHF